MNKYFRYISCLLLAFFLMTAFCRASAAGGEMSGEDSKKPLSEGMKIIDNMKFDPVEFKAPEVGKEIDRVELDNGMILYLREDRSLPMLQIYGLIRTGECYETRDKYGVAGLTGAVMRTGGTKNLNPDELNNELEYMAATLETGIGDEMGWISLDVISSQTGKAMKLMADVLMNPAFGENQLDLEKSRIKESLRRRNDNYSEIGDLEFYRIVYPDYCAGWEYDWDVVKKIGRDDLISWHRRFYHPNNMMFAVVGDFDKNEMIKRFNELFGKYPRTDIDYSNLQEVENRSRPGLFFASKETTQSYIRMGHLGVKRDNPDVYAIRLMDYILGNGGFNSMMMQKIRSDEGLAYSVFSYFNVSGRTFGTTGAVCSTKSESTVKAAKLMIELIERIRNEKVSREQLKWAKDSIINSFIFQFDTPKKQTIKLMMLEYDRMPLDFYQKYCENYMKVTEEDIQKAARQYLKPDELTIVVIGKPEDFGAPLSELGKPEEIELKEPNLD